MKAITPTKEQLKSAFSKIWRNDESMVNYCLKKIDTAVYLSDGRIFYTEKESIIKDFCFGYSDSSRDTQDYDRANDMARHAMKSEAYFRTKNLTACMQQLADVKNARYLYSYASYPNTDGTDSMLVTLLPLDEHIEIAREYNAHLRFLKQDLKFTLIGDEDRLLILQAITDHIERHTKRVNTYLKKYGLSKVSAWSYWQDA